MSVRSVIPVDFYKHADIYQFSISLVDEDGKEWNESKLHVFVDVFVEPKPVGSTADGITDAEFSSEAISKCLSANGQLRIRCRFETQECEFDNDVGLVEDLVKDPKFGDFCDAVLVRLGLIVILKAVSHVTPIVEQTYLQI